ncbi:MAG: hypothetical protein LBU44_02355 [Mediterranea sp.]|nr:hypothetical protein [Mediterranea sp.]
MVTLYPAAGLRLQTSGAFTNTDVSGYAWNCAVSGVNAYYLGFYSSIVYPSNNNARAYGLSVRCVQHLHCLSISVL